MMKNELPIGVLKKGKEIILEHPDGIMISDFLDILEERTKGGRKFYKYHIKEILLFCHSTGTWVCYINTGTTGEPNKSAYLATTNSMWFHKCKFENLSVLRSLERMLKEAEYVCSKDVPDHIKTVAFGKPFVFNGILAHDYDVQNINDYLDRHDQMLFTKTFWNEGLTEKLTLAILVNVKRRGRLPSVCVKGDTLIRYWNGKGVYLKEEKPLPIYKREKPTGRPGLPEKTKKAFTVFVKTVFADDTVHMKAENLIARFLKRKPSSGELKVFSKELAKMAKNKVIKRSFKGFLKYAEPSYAYKDVYLFFLANKGTLFSIKELHEKLEGGRSLYSVKQAVKKLCEEGFVKKHVVGDRAVRYEVSDKKPVGYETPGFGGGIVVSVTCEPKEVPSVCEPKEVPSVSLPVYEPMHKVISEIKGMKQEIEALKAKINQILSDSGSKSEVFVPKNRRKSPYLRRNKPLLVSKTIVYR